MTPTEEEICFFAELGFAIIQWAQVENTLRDIVNSCFGDDDHVVVQLGFFSIENFRSKLEFTDQVVNRRFGGEPQAAGWDALVHRTRTASTQRNKLVHRNATFILKGKPGRRWALQPWIVKKADVVKAGDTKPIAGSLCLRDIVALRHEFYALNVALTNFWHRLRGLKEPHAKSAEQATRPPTIQHIKRQILEGLEDPLRSFGKKS